jgi:hypothetical protein
LASTQTRSLEIASLSDLPTPSFVPIRYRPGDLGTWSGHLAFANDLIADVRPSLLVELGTHWGESYFTFCQSVFQNGVDCLCYAVDHWLGEQHAGHYGEEVFQDVQRFNEAHYRGFSYLLRTGFDEALQQFADDSIDLLHIDGLHTYEAVSHDFQAWLPKVKPGGIILMHDIAVRHADFGVWRFWDELKDEFAHSFTFHHWWGLGVLRKPGGSGPQSAFLDLLFHSSPVMAERIRRHYLMQTAFLENARLEATPAVQAAPAAASANIDCGAQSTTVQIYPFGSAGHSEESSIRQTIECGSWKDVTVTMPAGTGAGPIRIDPADCVSVIEIRGIALKDEESGEELFSALSADDFKDAQFSGSALVFSGDSACCILSCSSDPYFFLPSGWKADGPARLEISIQVRTSMEAAVPAFQHLHHAARKSTAHAEENGKLRIALAEAEKQGAEALAQSVRLEEQLATTTVRMREVQREARILQELLDSAENRAKEEAQTREASAAFEEELQSTRAALENERALLVNERILRAKMLHSKSWVLTKPLRGFMRLFKGGD